ncbi:MAG: EamA family transporter, partial [Nocardiopsaceae bacterium]|nr:EamA family transporter [Nocardiopsaceae bacterium]
MVLAAISFSLTAAFFIVLETGRHGLVATLRPLRELRRDVLAINVTTAVTWLSMFYALKYLEPAVVSVTVVALGPILTVVMGPVLRKGSSALPGETWISVGVLALLGVLVWESAAGRSGIGALGAGRVVAGFLFALACGVGSTANVIYMKRLSEAGQTPRAVLAIRFFLMIAVTWVATGFESQPRLGHAFWPAFVVAVIGVALPIYVLQVGIKHTEPITTSLLISVSPLFTLLLQLFDRRLHPSLASFACTLAVLVLVAVGVVQRSRTERRQNERCQKVKCAVVDAYGAGRLLPAALRRHGVDYLHVRSQHPDTNLSYVPDDFPLEIEHRGDVGETAARLRDHGVTMVVAAAESGVLLANELSAALGTPGNGTRRPEARRDKFAMHAAVRQAGLASADGIESPSAQAVLDWAVARGRWPVVLKPVASAGTDNVIFCDSPEALLAAHDKISASTDRYGRENVTVLAQEFLDGEEHYVNTVSRDGVHQIIEVWHYYKRPVPGGRSINDFEDLLSLDAPGARRVAAYVLAV